MLSKIATSINNIGIKETKARDALRSIFDQKNKVSIEEVFAEQFEMRYDERKVLISVESIYEYLEQSLEEDANIEISDQLKGELTKLKRLIDRFLRS
jgi:ParB family transcriptional regulator, chromosome partitioning protein